SHSLGSVCPFNQLNNNKKGRLSLSVQQYEQVSTVTVQFHLNERPSPRVLIVEDNALIALDLESILTSHGCEIVGYSASVRDALAALSEDNIDVAVVDFLLNDGDAAPLVKALSSRRIPFAICTGAPKEVISSRYPHTPILGKPYNPDDVNS